VRVSVRQENHSGNGNAATDFEFEGEKAMKLTLGKKLALGFGVIMALMVLSASMTYLKLSDMKRAQDRALDVRFPSIAAAKDLQRDLNQTQSKGRQAVLSGTRADKRASAKSSFDQAWNEVDKDLAALEQLAPKWGPQSNRDRLGEIKTQLPALRGAQEAAITDAASGERDAVISAGSQFTDQAMGVADAIRNSLNAIEDSLSTLVGESKEELLADNHSISLTMAMVTCVSMAIGIFIAIFVSRGITGQVTREKLALDAMLADSAMLSKAAAEGKLETRADVSKHQGAYAEIVRGLNGILDAILLPIGEGNRILSLIRGGNLREKVEIACKGDHAKMKDAVNGVHAWLTELTAYATKIANGDMSATMTKASDADQIHEWLVLMKNNIHALAADVIMLSKTAVEGKLATRADASKHQGDYRKIVEGVNQTLDAVIGPLNMAARYVDQISQGEVPAKITDAYNGDFNNIKNHLNACIDGLGGLVEANEVLQSMAANDYTTRVQGTYRGVFAEVGKATNKTADTVRTSMEMLGQNVQALSSAAEELTATSQQMSANAEETSAQTRVVSAATLQVNQNLQTVATGAEQMGASIKEIAKNATDAARVATSAVKVAETANTTVSKLGDSSTEIGQVIKVITSIAQQTNLLALNATIEAARAGEAGKGFAVVANEVKELAKETAKATEDISRKIEAIQTDTKAAVSAIGTISEVINQINGISNTIATAVEEQNATTNEMARNVSEAARGSGEITSNISGVAEAAQGTTHGAAETQKAAGELAKMATQLRGLVEQFKIEAGDSNRSKAASHAAGAR
jgi:methyl-accepting chemotaxis protein